MVYTEFGISCFFELFQIRHSLSAREHQSLVSLTAHRLTFYIQVIVMTMSVLSFVVEIDNLTVSKELSD